MATNRWRGDAAARAKLLHLLQPNNVKGVLTTVSVGNKSLEFTGFNATEIANGINGANWPELTNVTASVSGVDVRLTGIENEDFDVSMSISPTVEAEFINGRPAKNQITRLNFQSATGGTFTLTCNNETTSAITLFTSGNLNTGGIETAIEALTSFVSGDVEATVDSGDVLLEWKGNFASAPVAVKMDATELNNGGSIVISETQSARPATHDIWWLGIDGDYVFDISDGTTTVEIKSNESESTIAQKLSAAWGGQVDVYAHTTTSELTQRNAYRRIMYLDMVGFAGTSTTLTVSGIEPNDATSPQVVAVKVIDQSDATPAEVILVDQRAGAIDVAFDGKAIDWTNYSDTLDDLNQAIQFGEWTGFRGPTGSSGGTQLGGGNLQVEEMYLLIWMDDGPRRANGYPPSQVLPIDDGGGTDLDVSRFTNNTNNLGSLTVLQHGGSTNAARPAVHEYYLQPNTSGNTLTGSYKLEFAEGVTTALTHASNAAAVQSAINTATGITVAVTGSGTAAVPFSISYTGDTESRSLPTSTDVAFTGDGSGTVTTDQARDVGASASGTIRVSETADGGSYDLIIGNEGPVTFAWNENQAGFLAHLQEFPALATSGDVTVTYNSASREYRIAWASNLALQSVDQPLVQRNALTSSTQGVATREIITYPTGPGNWADADNWSLARVPEIGDEIVIDSATAAITYGLRQFVPVTISTSANTLTAPHDFVNGQKLQFVFGTTAPTGVSAATDYYVVNSNRVDGIFQVSATESGAAVNITAAGTGPHYCGVIANDVKIAASFDQTIGYERANVDGFEEYRERFLQIGVLSTGQILVGDGDGTGSGLIRIDAGNSAGQITVNQTGSSEELNKPPVVIDALSDTLNVLVQGGDVGIAVYQDETAKIGSFNVIDGSLFVGSVTVAGNAIAASGTLTAERMSVSGLVNIKP